jgi:hypothetical protein
MCPLSFLRMGLMSKSTGITPPDDRPQAKRMSSKSARADLRGEHCHPGPSWEPPSCRASSGCKGWSAMSSLY